MLLDSPLLNRLLFITGVSTFTHSSSIFFYIVLFKQRDKLEGNYNLTKEMIERFPLVVHSADQFGNSLFHFAAKRDDDKLLVRANGEFIV